MKKTKLRLYKPEDIEPEKDTIYHHNAFILPTGEFYLAKGYQGCNPHHQIESSALQIARQDFDFDLKEAYEKFCEKQCASLTEEDKKNFKRVWYLRTILMHYCGYAIFARQENIVSFNERDTYYDCSAVPDPEYYGKMPTLEQLNTLESLFKLNDDETFRTGRYTKDSEEQLKKVITYCDRNNSWHI